MTLFLLILLAITIGLTIYYQTKGNRPRSIAFTIISALLGLVVAITIIHVIWMTLLSVAALTLAIITAVLYIKNRRLKAKQNAG